MIEVPARWVVESVLVGLLLVSYVSDAEGRVDGRSWFWWPLRRRFGPSIHQLVQPIDPEVCGVVKIGEREHVATVRRSLDELKRDLFAAGYHAQPVASIARDWTGRQELASYAKYCGPKPSRWLPDNFRLRQVHVRLFTRSNGRIAITAHEEYCVWRPDRWLDHITAKTCNAVKGLAMLRTDLNLRPTRARARSHARSAGDDYSRERSSNGFA